MIPVLTADAMRAADDYTIRTFGIPGSTLMESAGRATAYALHRRLDSKARVAVYCGRGNNGGDGFVIARYLHHLGASVHVVHLASPGSMSEDAARQFQLLRMLEAEDADDRLHLEPFDEGTGLPRVDAHVDALLGTGLTSELREPIRSLITRLNEAEGFKAAVDVPTGLHSDIGRPLGTAFRADVTFTMGALKAGLCLNDGPAFSGDREILDIGIPPYRLRQDVERGVSGCARLSTFDDVRAWLPERGSDANKYSAGLALIVAGAPGMTGAPVMAASAAARGGAGYVVCAADHRIQAILSTKLTEVTTMALPADDRGLQADRAMDAIRDRLGKAASVLVGCGLGREDGTQELVRTLLDAVDVPVVVDADGLNALVGHTDLLRKRAGGRWILTPHMGEFRRLAEEEGGSFDPDDRIALAQHFARAWNCVLILKGLPSVTATPKGTAWINATGGPSLASAGTGDVLAGLCTGLLAQGLPAEQAAVAALHVGGAAADRYTSTREGRSLMAMDVVNELPYVLSSF